MARTKGPTTQPARFGCLRSLAPQDARGMLEWMHDERVSSVFQRDFSSMTERDVLDFISRAPSDETSLHFAVVDGQDEYMGTVSLKNIDLVNECAEYAIAMRTRAQGTGLARKATEDVVRYAFERVGLHRVYLNVRVDNLRAKRFYEKVGFSHEGTSRDALKIGGQFCDLDWYCILETDATSELATS